MPEVKAQLNYLRISPRKVRAVTELIIGLDADEAKAYLKYVTRRPARPLLKLLNSAISNAQHNFNLNKNHLYIKRIRVDEGAKLKRFKPKGFGLVMPIQKKTSHIQLVLDELSEEKKKKKDEILSKIKKPEAEKSAPAKAKEARKEKKELKAEKPKIGKRIEKVSRKGVFGGIKTLGRRLFRRKTV